jgi:hypothetical protein
MIVAFIALGVALSGTTYAVSVSRLPKRSVGSSQIKRRAVHAKHIKARNVTRSKIARNAVSGSLVEKDSLHGSDILEASLAKVPSAKDADNAAAINGLGVRKFAFRAAMGQSMPSLVNMGGLALNVACNVHPAPPPGGGPALSVSATTTASGANIHSGGTWGAANQSFYAEDDSFDVGDTFDPLQDGTTGSTNLSGTLVYARQDGGVVTVDFLAEETATGCVFAGSAIG